MTLLILSMITLFVGLIIVLHLMSQSEQSTVPHGHFVTIPLIIGFSLQALAYFIEYGRGPEDYYEENIK